MIGLLTLLLTGLALLWLLGVAFVVWMLTHPPRRTYATAVARGVPGDPSEMASGSRAFEAWAFRGRGLEFPVWDVPGDKAGGPVVIMTSGWADSRVGGLVRLGCVLPSASRVILWDMPGHGEAPGICRLGVSEVDDLLALIEHLKVKRPVLFGWSLGAGVSIAAAARLGDSIGGVIAETPYRMARTPARNVMRLRGLPDGILIGPAFAVLRAMLGNGLSDESFDRATLAAKVTVPVLVAHGDADEVCPVEDGRAIAAACEGEMIVVPGGKHNDLWTEPRNAAVISARIADFIAARGSGSPVT